MRVVRWNHSGDSNKNPEQHQAGGIVLRSDARTRRPADLRAGVAEDFPNGGGNRAFLFTVDGPNGRYSWFYQNSASPSDLSVSIIMDGTDYGAPLENLKAATARCRGRSRRSVDRHRRHRHGQAAGPGAQAQGLSAGALGRFLRAVRARRDHALLRSRARSVSGAGRRSSSSSRISTWTSGVWTPRASCRSRTSRSSAHSAFPTRVRHRAEPWPTTNRRAVSAPRSSPMD